MPAPCLIYPSRRLYEGDLEFEIPDTHSNHNNALVAVEGSSSHFAFRLQRLASVVAIKRSEIIKYLASAIIVGGLVGYFVNQIPPLHS